MLKKLFKTGVTAAAGWVGNAIGGPTGSMFAKKITSSLFDRDGAGGNFQLQDTSVATQNFGGKVGFERSDDAIFKGCEDVIFAILVSYKIN